MTEPAERRFSDYSSGMKQRMAIARSMLHDPPILLMDEPTRSLDPASALALRGFFRNRLAGEQGKTIVLATHNLREAEAVCDRIAILVKGRVRQIGTVGEVRRWGVQQRQYRLLLAAWPDAIAGRFEALNDAAENGCRRVTVAFDGEDQLDGLLRALVSAGVTIHSCERMEPDLEDAFSRILASEAGEGEA